MAAASLRYDHPAYTVPVVYSGSSTAGANGVTTKFCAFTALKLKQVVSGVNLALPTSAAGSQPLLYTQSGTTTSTTTLTVLTSASYAVVTDDISDVTLAAGNAFWITHGADAQTSRSYAVEAYVIPGSNLQV
jgi:hypothetical protein